MPMMPFIGVRISWLMLARNSLLARFAPSASILGLLEFGIDAIQRRRVPPDEEREDHDVRQDEQRQPHHVFDQALLLGVPPQPACDGGNQDRGRQQSPRHHPAATAAAEAGHQAFVGPGTEHAQH